MVGDIPAGDENVANLFSRCRSRLRISASAQKKLEFHFNLSSLLGAEISYSWQHCRVQADRGGGLTALLAASGPTLRRLVLDFCHSLDLTEVGHLCRHVYKRRNRVLVERVILHCKKKVNDFPVPSRDVTNQTLSGLE